MCSNVCKCSLAPNHPSSHEMRVVVVFGCVVFFVSSSSPKHISVHTLLWGVVNSLFLIIYFNSFKRSFCAIHGALFTYMLCAFSINLTKLHKTQHYTRARTRTYIYLYSSVYSYTNIATTTYHIRAYCWRCFVFFLPMCWSEMLVFGWTWTFCD